VARAVRSDTILSVPARKRYDIAIIGGGLIGSSAAMGLAERGLSVAVVDADLSGRLSSSEKNAGGVRATWWQPVNIRLCRQSIKYYESIRAEVGFQQLGYLWLYDEATWSKAQEHLPLQRELGHRIEELTARQVNQKVPEIDRLNGIAGATFSPDDGLLNPNLLKEHYRSRSRERGVDYLDATYVVQAAVAVDEVRLQCWQAARPLSDAELARLLAEDGRGEAAPGRLFELRAGAVLVAAGAWSDNVDRLFGLKNYSEAVRRQIAIVDNRATNLAGHGMIVDTSGLYFHHEGTHILAGYSPPDTPAGHHFDYDGERFFEDEIWPRMYARMSCCERLRHVMGWAGLYELSPDRSAIIGAAAPRIYEAHSFSGRGAMQSYGAGQAIAELIAFGGYRDFDASGLGRDRFDHGAPVPEELHI